MLATSLDTLATSMSTILIILLTTALMTKIMKHFHRPPLLGILFAAGLLSSVHLPEDYFSLSNISILGSIGAYVYLVLIVSKMDFRIILSQKKILALPIIHTFIVIALGYFAAPYLVKYNDNLIDPMVFSLMIGVLLSSTSLPIILFFTHQIGVDNHPIGHVTQALTIIEDAIFILFYVVLGIVVNKGSTYSSEGVLYLSIGLAVLLIVLPVTTKVIIPRIKSYKEMLLFILCGTLISCYAAYDADIHLPLGVVIFALMLPRNNLLILKIYHRLNGIIWILFIPIYLTVFAHLLRSHIDLNLNVLLIGAIVALVAFMVKFTYIYFATTRCFYYTSTKSLFLASILNIRGISQILLIQSLYEDKIISNSIFAIFYISALITTFVSTGLMFYFRQRLPK
jgi:Kef-type K+ transport system membrane component KefB